MQMISAAEAVGMRPHPALSPASLFSFAQGYGERELRRAGRGERGCIDGWRDAIPPYVMVTARDTKDARDGKDVRQERELAIRVG